MDQIVEEVHKGVRKVNNYRKIYSDYKNQIWSLDLIEMQEFENENKGFRYILNCIDLYTRYVFAIPLKTKTGKETAIAIQKIITTAKGNPEKFWTDEGKEFLNKNVDDLRKKYNIEIYHTYGIAKAAIIERYNRTQKSNMYKFFTKNGNHIWYNILDDIVKLYNNKKHSGINNLTPKNAYFGEIDLQKEREKEDTKEPKFNINDRVRISYKRDILDQKGYLPNWTYQIYIITHVLKTNPITYKLKTEDDNEEIKGSFYESEMQLTKQKKGVYLINKILKTRTVKGKKQYFVSWIGYDNSKNSWIDDDKTEYLKNINQL